MIGRDTQTPLVRSVRARLAGILAREARQVRPRPLLAIGADGIDLATARRHWSADTTVELHAETPTTSSSGWMSALTGLSPVDHGAIGAYQKNWANEAPLSVFAQNSGPFARAHTVFEDAAALGYVPIFLTADFADLDGPWLRGVSAGAELREGPRIVAATGVLDAAADVSFDIWEAAIRRIITAPGPPAFVFSIIDLDLHIHRFGHDARLSYVLRRIDSLMRNLSPLAVCAAFADHGLVPTHHDPHLSWILERVCTMRNLVMAGAGRMRWLHRAPSSPGIVALIDELHCVLPANVRICRRCEIFDDGPFLHRVGEIVLIAEETAFLTDPCYAFDHGSFLEDECSVPFSTWGEV